MDLEYAGSDGTRASDVVAMSMRVAVLMRVVIIVLNSFCLWNYSASMPTWYCTFLATFGVAALLRHLEVGRRRWLVVAGLSAGFSITIKIVGVYFVAAALVYFAYKASSERRDAVARSGRRLSNGFAVGGAILSAALFGLLRADVTASVIVNFAVPVVALACFVFVSARLGEDAGTANVRSFMALAAPLRSPRMMATTTRSCSAWDFASRPRLRNWARRNGCTRTRVASVTSAI